jgi:hypothetical protein
MAGKPWGLADQPYYIGEGGSRRIQGPDSALVKFGKVLCQNCNNARTQPFDLAYERFAAWVNSKGDVLLEYEYLDFTEVYGPGCQTGILNLLKYFVKHLGCRLASEGHSLPEDYAALIAKTDLTPFEVSLARNAEIAGARVRSAGVLHNFPTVGMLSPGTMIGHGPYLSGMIVGHLDVVYRFDYSGRYFWEVACTRFG